MNTSAGSELAKLRYQKDKEKALTCENCKKDFTGFQGQKYCSPPCKRRAAYNRARKRGYYEQ